MASYKEIFGTNIEVLASDPANPVTGQVWYNSTDNLVKGAAATTAGAWATGGSLNTPTSAMGYAGTQTASLAVGGEGPTGIIGNTQSYNGSSWTEVNDLNTARYSLRGGGTQTSALQAGGETYPYTAATESWNGSSWTEVNDLNTARTAFAGGGADNTNSIVFAGRSNQPAPTANVTGLTESWNGSSWTEVNDMNTARKSNGGCGINTAALTFGGDLPGVTAVTESWNGTSWTEVGDLNTARFNIQGTGTYTLALAYGGQTPSNTAATEEWNGTSWSETTDLSIARDRQGATGTQTAALAFGGNPLPTAGTATEEWTGAGAPLIQTFTDS